MAARDRYGADLRCEDCRTAGRVECGEADYPFMRSADFQIDSLTGPFTATKIGETSLSTDIVCDRCGKKVW